MSRQPSEIAAARRRLAARIWRHTDGQGLITAPCRSRALESALALRLLQAQGFSGPERGRLIAFLERTRRTSTPGSLDSLLAGAALGTEAPAGASVERALDRFDHFTRGRKQVLMRAVRVVLDGAPVAGAAPPGRPPQERLTPWSTALSTACQVILGAAPGPPRLTTLLFAQRSPGIWEGHLLCHLLTLHALRRVPGQEAVVADGTARMLARQNADGGIPFICGEETYATAVAVVGLALGRSPDQGRPLLALADRLRALQDDDGGWAYAPDVRQTDVDTTGVCVEALRAVDPLRYREAINGAGAYLRARRGADGGFPTYLPGAPSEAVMTAAAARALDLDEPDTPELLGGALAFIAAHQSPQGTYGPGWSRCDAHAVFRTVLALRRARSLPDPGLRRTARRATESGLGHLVRTQNPDGGWGQREGEASDAISTALSLATLAGSPAAPPLVVHRGTGRLLACESSDGSFPSRPDSTGPRGLVFDVPVLSDVYVLLALARLATPRHARSQGVARSFRPGVPV
ncbi:prenyltransferase/squalene oxidase repeat-containing protein [Streptomyces olivoreticuli]